MPKAKASGHVGCAKEIDFQQLVDGLHHRRLGHPGRGRGELRLERIARHRRSFQQKTFGVGELRELLCECRSDGRRNPDGSQRRLVVQGQCSTCSVERPGELLKIEGVASALRVEDVRVNAIDRVAQELSRLLGAERAELDVGQQVGAPRPLERARQTLRQLARTHGQRQEHRRSRRPAEKRAEQLDRRRVGPVEVIQYEYERLRRRKLLEQRAHRTVAAVALVLWRQLAPGRERGQRREDVRKLRLNVVVEGCEAIPVEPPHVLVERINEDRERQVLFELGRRAR
jgi:hypothetical protein